MTASPRSTIALAALLTLAVTLLMLTLALATPRLGIVWSEGPDGTLKIEAVHENSPQAGYILPGTLVSQFLLPGGTLTASPELLAEEPDTLPDYNSYNNFMRNQQQLADAIHQNKLQLQLADGQVIDVSSYPADVGQLPFLFWFQIFVGAAGVITGAIVWTLGTKNRATLLYALTGIGYLIFAPTAAVYSTRELAMNADVFRALSIANHFGALFFTASLTALLWHYPKALGRLPTTTACYFIALIIWLLDTFQAFDTPDIFHLGVLGIFLGSLLFAVAQWFRTRGQPAERAALRWFLLSIYLATGLFAGTIIIPAALNLPLIAPQGVMFGAFLIMYFGLALGVVRYRLFRLEEWWYAIWSWLLSGIAIIALDFFLIGALNLEAGIALTLALAIIGWLYFPMRQWLWGKLGRTPQRRMQDWLPAALPLLIQIPEGEDREQRLLARWPNLLRTVFEPLSIEECDGNMAILEDGLALRVEGIGPYSRDWLLRHANQGSRLFTKHDLETQASLRHLFELSIGLLHAHETGADEERERIARDLHDDLGAKLLTLLHRCDKEERPLVRDAITSTRELINTLNVVPVNLTTAISRWRIEIKERCDSSGINFQWTTDGNEDGSLILTARQYANLSRILRESVTNAIKHGHPRNINIGMKISDNIVRVRIQDDGQGKIKTESAAHEEGGRGFIIMQARAEEMDGIIHWNFDKGCMVDLRFPISKASNGHA